MKKPVIAIVLTTIWISISEFTRNEFLFKSIWVEHYKQMGLEFPSEPLNGAVWGIWAFIYALSGWVMCRKFGLWQAAALFWVQGFVLMWLVIGNLKVLPWGILPLAIPLSMLEALVAVWILKRIATE